jgi:hypothetical protein
MSKFGSMTNLLLSGTKGAPKPEVGMGATLLMYSDRHPYTIVEVRNDGKLIGVQRDDAKRTDKNGCSESQEYEYSRCPDAPVEWYSLRKNGSYVLVGESMNGSPLRIGDREEYYDFSR